MSKAWDITKKIVGFDVTKFLIVGGLGVVTDQATFSFLRYLFDLTIERDQFLLRFLPIFGYTLAVVQNYLLNHYWTFRSRVSGSSASLRGLMLFFLVSMIALVPRLLTYYLVLSWFDPTSTFAPDISNFIGIVVATLVNFFGTKYFVFVPDSSKKQ